MIVVDQLFDTTPFTRASTPRCFKNTLACHMMTTLEGVEGIRELINFARLIGLQPSWIQKAGTRWQHFDLTEGKRRVAVAKGAREVCGCWAPGDPIE